MTSDKSGLPAVPSVWEGGDERRHVVGLTWVPEEGRYHIRYFPERIRVATPDRRVMEKMSRAVPLTDWNDWINRVAAGPVLADMPIEWEAREDGQFAAKLPFEYGSYSIVVYRASNTACIVHGDPDTGRHVVHIFGRREARALAKALTDFADGRAWRKGVCHA